LSAAVVYRAEVLTEEYRCGPDNRGTKHIAIATRLNHSLGSITTAIRGWLRQRQPNMDAVEEWRKLSNLEFIFRKLCTEKHQLLPRKKIKK
jgi:hypothetical protein